MIRQPLSIVVLLAVAAGCRQVRAAARARAQETSFRRCLDQVEWAERLVPAASRRMLFERIGYPAGFLCTASGCCAELALAAAAREEGNVPGSVRHLRAAWAYARERDELDARYNAGKWTHWYDRNIIYPYPGISDRIRVVLEALEKEETK